jgi:hypothetical protein
VVSTSNIGGGDSTPDVAIGPPFDSRHALFVEWVVGIARENGVEAWWPDERRATLRIDLGPDVPVTLTVAVPAPPADWTAPDA